MRRHNRIAGLLGHVFLITPSEALDIIKQRDVAKIREAWLDYTRYKGRPNVSKVIRDSACAKAQMILRRF